MKYGPSNSRPPSASDFIPHTTPLLPIQRPMWGLKGFNIAATKNASAPPYPITPITKASKPFAPVNAIRAAPSAGGTCTTGYSCNPLPTQDCTSTPTNPMVDWTSGTACNTSSHWIIHNTPSFWETPAPSSVNYIYVAPSGPSNNPIAMYQYKLCSGHNPPVCGTVTTTEKFPFGSTPSVSASAPETASDGIVWAIAVGDVANPSNPESTVPGILYAYQASNMQRLYASSSCANDVMNPATKYSVPTIANGYVYVGTESANTNQQNTGLGTFYIFGLGRTGC